MTLQAQFGLLFDVGGAIAGHADCCAADCAEELCLGCFNGDDVPSLTIDLDAASATGSHPDAIFNGCSDTDCQDLTGAYVADYTTPPTGFVGGCDTSIGPYCWWSLPISADNSIPCESNTFSDAYYQYFGVAIGKDSVADEWFIFVFLSLGDNVVSPSGFTQVWRKSLGTTKPNCLTEVFPITITDADFCFPITAEGGEATTCDLSDGVTMTVSIT